MSNASADPRVRRTRKLLQEALLALLAERDFHTITVQEIAERAEVNRATFYAHFEDKYALLQAVVKERFDRLLNKRLPADPTLSIETLRALMLATFEFMAEFPKPCVVNGQRPPIERWVNSLLQAQILQWAAQTTDHVCTAEAFPDALATVLSWSILGAAQEWAHSDRKIPADVMVSRVMSILTQAASERIPGR